MKNKVIAFLFFIIGAAATAQQHAADTVTHGILQPTVVLCSTRPAPREVAAKSPVVTKSPIVSRLLTGEMLTDQHSAGVGLFTNFDSDDGLALDGITYGDKSSICDHQGNLWFGTIGGGVSKYDGQHFTTYTTNQGLGNNYVFSIAEDKDGNFWFGTDGGGVSKYDGQSFTTYTTSQGLGADIVLSILEDDAGNLWFGTHGGISK
ncbi:MAG: hypothetical protein HQ500_02845 [Flavobacteriales bacterium]|nr:hypothetical protein [Flavobacteriales bacterium]